MIEGIRFETSTSPALDEGLLRDVYSVVAPSMRSNFRHYHPASIETALKAYTPLRFKDWYGPLLFRVFAYDEDRLVGVGFLKQGKTEDVAELGVSPEQVAYSFGGFVDPAKHGRGIGSEMLRRRIEYARKLGVKFIRANASEASIKMTKSMGAAEIGEFLDEALKNHDGTPARLHKLEYRL
ncbi:GNAT family N-acetyltransferase [Candidatus Woesearchaeota archaeon]|nr:GNAT family N-acetyltransferase [Candidatus Woesearchaeota archaeon]